jgi:hypothetical protein
MIHNFILDFWPFVFFKSTGFQLNDDYFEEFKKFYLKLLIRCKNNNHKMILICDLNSIHSFPIEFIIKQAHFTKQIFNFNKLYLQSVCILCKDKTFKNVLNLFFSFSKPAAPVKLCRSFDKINKFLLKNFNISFDFNNSLFLNLMYNYKDNLNDNLDNLDNDDNEDNHDNEDNDSNDNDNDNSFDNIESNNLSDNSIDNPSDDIKTLIASL